MAADALVDRKWMRVDTLRDVLAGLPDDRLVMPNLVGNLAVYVSATDGTPGRIVGAIDFLDETYESFDEDEP